MLAAPQGCRSWKRGASAPLFACGICMLVWAGQSVAGEHALPENFARPLFIPAPAANPLTREKIALGRRLFNDPFLSESGTRACASCHYPIQAFTDGLPRARAFGRELQRNTPGLWNLAWRRALFWDGRAASLEDQVAEPLTLPEEMGHSLDEAAQRIAARPGYAAQFAQAFPEAPGITPGNLARALASYERSLVSPLTRFDTWIAGDESSLNGQEIRGFALFTGTAGCITCHAGFAFADDRFYAIGAQDADAGRAGVTHSEKDNHAFRTPTLRELAYTAPYLHDGSAATVSAAIDAHAGVTLSEGERAALVAFLATLSSAGSPLAAPPLDAQGDIATKSVPE